MNMNLNMNVVSCPFHKHENRKIIAICFNKDCKSKRLCCLQCNGEFHRAHPENLIEIDLFNSFIQQESIQQAEYPDSYTQGQCQLIQGMEGLLNLIDDFQKLILEQLEKIKKSNLQEYLKQQSIEQQGIQFWNQQIECMLQYFEVKNYLLYKKDKNQDQINETEKKYILIIQQVKDSLKQIEKSFFNSLKHKELKFSYNSEKLEGHQNFVNGVVISSDGSKIASASPDKTVKLWNSKTKELLQTLEYNGEMYGGIALSSNNRYLAYGGDGDYSIKLQDLEQINSYATLIGHKSNIQTICFSGDSQLLYSGGFDNKLIVWNISNQTQIHSFDTDSYIRTIVNSSDGQLISCICYKSINIWDYQKKTHLIHQIDPHNANGYGLCSSKDSSLFISSGEDGLIKIWMLSSNENNQKSLTLSREIKAADKTIFKVILTPDEQYIVSICNAQTKIMIHELDSGNLIQELQYGDANGYYPNGYISISDDMNVLASGGEDSTVKIWTRE